VIRFVDQSRHLPCGIVGRDAEPPGEVEKIARVAVIGPFGGASVSTKTTQTSS